MRLNVAIVVGDGDRMETGSSGAGGRVGYERYLDPQQWKAQVDEALRQALVNLGSVPAPAGEMTVVLGPGWPGVLLHEAIGHGLEGDFNRKETSAFSGRIGAARRAPRASRSSTTARCPTGAARSTSTTRARRRSCTVLIEDGILKGYMQDRLNARLMGVAPTGNGRRECFAHVPMPRMTNTYMLAGDHDPQEIIASVKRGLYAVNFGGGQVDITSGKFVFSATEAYLIEDGKVGTGGQGRDPDRQRPRRADQGHDDRQRPEARRRRRHLRQGRPERAGRRRPADPAHRRADGRRHERRDATPAADAPSACSRTTRALSLQRCRSSRLSAALARSAWACADFARRRRRAAGR